jgi:RHS repeat-associated protein
VDQVKYTYDALNTMTSETDVIGGSSYTISYGYDSTGNVQSITYPDHTTVTNSYDALGRTTKVAAGSATYASFTYNPDGTINTVTYGNGEVTSYTYDSMSRPKTITTSLGSTKELSLTYSYDGTGNVVSINSETFGYDALNRLTSATGSWGTTTYSYDAAGNMAQEQNSSSSTATKYTYNDMDELVRSNSASGATAYSYDGDGDLVIKNDGTNVWTYVYNEEGEMTKVLENGVLVQQNYYDGNGRRVEQAAGGTTTLYLYAGLDVLYQKNLQTGAATKYVYADGMQVTAITTSTLLFFHQDELGSTRLVTSGSSSVFSSDYVPYGVQYGATGSSQEFMYTGMLYDAATGLYYDNARFYDPTTGKFLTADPAGGTPSDPQSLNDYAYARGNPLAIVDPSGLSWNPVTWSPTTWLLLGAAVGLFALNTVQGGLDPITDALDAGAISEFATSVATIGALAVGLPVVIGSTEEGNPDFEYALGGLTNLESPLLGLTDIESNMAGPSILELQGDREFENSAINNPFQPDASTTARGAWAEQVVREQMGGSSLLASQWRGGFQVDVYDIELDQAWEVKEGASAVRIGQLDNMANAGFKGGWGYVFVQNPYTGKIGPEPGELGEILSRGGSVIQMYTKMSVPIP